MHKLKLYGTPLSGHVHRVALLLSMLELPYEFIESPAEVRQSEAFRRLNPLGQIPVLVDGDLTLADSNAILVYLAKNYAPGSHWRRRRCRRGCPKRPEKYATVRRPAA